MALKVTTADSVLALVFNTPVMSMVSPASVRNEAVTLPEVSVLMLSEPLLRNAPPSLKAYVPDASASRVVATAEVTPRMDPDDTAVSDTAPSSAA